MLNSEPSPELDKQQRNAPITEQQVKMAATETGSPRRLGINLNLSVQPHVTAYHWPHSTVAEDASSPSRSKGCTDDDDDDDVEEEEEEEDDERDVDDDEMDCRQDDECSPEDEQNILEMQREERETLNQLARQLASGSRLMAPMLQHLVYQHPGLSVQPSSLHHHQQQQLMQSSQQLQPSGVAVSLTSTRRPSAAADLSPRSSHSGDAPVSGGRPADVHSPSAGRNSEAQSWTFEEQFRQLYSAGNENDRRSFLDSLFSFMQEQGTPISRLPIMAKRVLDLYTLYKLVVQRGGIVAVITKKLWQEIIRGLGLPPSITSAAFTLRTQYVKYLYAYESRMNQFSTLDELNMAIAGNRREGRRNKSLMYSDMPPPGHPHHPHHHSLQHPHQQQQQQHHHNAHHSHSIAAGSVPPPPPPQSQSHHHHHFANVLAVDDRFRHLAAAIIDNHHHAAAAAVAAGVGVADHPGLRQSCSPPQLQQQQQQLQLQECKASGAPLQQLQQASRSPVNGPPPPTAPVPSATSLYNGHHQQSVYLQHQQHQSNALQSTNEQTNKQRELLSMLMWMDIVRANQTLPRLPIPSLPTSPSAAYTVAAALNLTPAYKGPMVSSAATAAVVPEQSEALNLGKKRTSNNNNGEEDEDAGGGGGGDGSSAVPAKRFKTEPQRSPAAVSSCSSGEDVETVAAQTTDVGGGCPSPTTAQVASRFRSDQTIDDDVVEMDINTSSSTGSSGNNGLAICVTRRTKNGVYRGELTKSNTLINGGVNNNANPFVLHLNGDLYTGHLQLQQKQQHQHQQTTSN